jgi:hypothetical protein
MKQKNTLYLLSLLLGALIIVANGMGLMQPEIMYAKESSNWFFQSVGQDIVDLVLVFPVLMITTAFIYRGNRRAMLVLAGVLVYLIYTFIIYCFAIHFNKLFLVYCLILGLSFFVFLWIILSSYKEPVNEWVKGKYPRKLISVYLITVAVIFYCLWLLQVIPASLDGTVPSEVLQAGLVTNPVHVLDLSVCLPGIAITGILLLRQHNMGLLLTPVVLTFFTLMDLTIAALMFILNWRGFPVNFAVLVSMLCLAVFSGFLLTVFLRSIKET